MIKAVDGAEPSTTGTGRHTIDTDQAGRRMPSGFGGGRAGQTATPGGAVTTDDSDPAAPVRPYPLPVSAGRNASAAGGVSTGDRAVAPARLAVMATPDVSATSQRPPRADEAGTSTVIVQPQDFRLPDVLRHIEAGKIVLIIPQQDGLDLAA